MISHATMAQQKCAGTSCTCGSSLIAGGCSSGVCCKPNEASCSCAFYSNSCKCGPPGATSSTAGTSTVPIVYEQNAQEFASYLNSSDFSSAESKEIAAKLPTLIAAARNNDPVLYDVAANQLEILSNNLPSAEKKKANAWVAARGGTVFIQ